MNIIKIGIANDHTGNELKIQIVEYLKNELNIPTVIDFGTYNNESVDYPDYAKRVCTAIEHKNIYYGILICGSGIGMSICANRNKNIRAALCHTPELAKLSRQHNDANVLILGARYIAFEEVKIIIKSFLTHRFKGGKHQERVEKL